MVKFNVVYHRGKSHLEWVIQGYPPGNVDTCRIVMMVFVDFQEGKCLHHLSPFGESIEEIYIYIYYIYYVYF